MAKTNRNLNADQVKRDRETIASMKRNAQSYGLWSEVRGDYLHFRKNDAPADAAWCAQYEWDI